MSIRYYSLILFPGAEARLAENFESVRATLALVFVWSKSFVGSEIYNGPEVRSTILKP